MPYINQAYSATASINPSNATGVTYLWTLSSQQGFITSGQATSAINYYFTTLGQKTISLTVSNQCSSVTSTKNFNVCLPITNLAVVKQNNSATVVGSNHGYDLSVGQGAPVSITWSIEGGGTIVGDPYSSSVIIQITSTQMITLLATVTDCEGVTYTTGKEITGTTTAPVTPPTTPVTPPTACVPLVSCSF